MAMQPQGLQALMPQRPQPISQPRPAMPNMANPRMSTALGLVDDDLERAGIDPRTRAAMKAQEAVDLLASADADMAMGQPTPMPEKIIDQRKQQANEGVVGILQRLMPGMQQRGQQMQRSSPMGGMPARPAPARPPMGGMPARPAPARPPMGGMPARPAPARPPMGGMPSMGAPNMARMADGGIVGYAGPDGSTVEAMAPQTPMAPQTQNPSPGYLDPEVATFLRKLQELNKQLDAAFPQEKDLFEQKITDLLNTTSPRVKRIASDSQFGLPKQGMAMGGIVGYAGPDGSEVELDPEYAAIIEEIRASAPEPRSGLEASQATAAKLKELFGPDAEFIAAREKKAAERDRLKEAGLSGRDINTALERRSQQRAGRSAVGVNKPMDLGGVAGLLKPKTNANFNLIDDSRIGTAEGGMGKPQTKTTTTPEQESIEKMREEQTRYSGTQRTPSALETQLETALGTQLGVMDGARDKETALAEAALGVSEAEKQAAEELVKADEAYYGKVLDPAERRRRENEVIMQAYLSGNSLVDQARRSGAAQSQLRRQGYTQEREAAKVRPTATREQEQTARGIRGEAYTAGREAEKDARSTLNQAIQTTGNYINSIANREARAALESSSQSMQILAAEMDLLIEGKRLDAGDKDRLARELRNIRDNIVKLRQSVGDVAGDPVMGDEAISREQQTFRDAIRLLELQSDAIAEEIGLPMPSPRSSEEAGSTGDPELDKLLQQY